MISILTPCSAPPQMISVLQHTQKQFHQIVSKQGLRYEWLVDETPGITVSELRRNLLVKARGTSILWWDADDWIRPEWVLMAQTWIKRFDVIFPKKMIRADVLLNQALVYNMTRGSMAGGLITRELASQYPYPDAAAGSLDSDSVWWSSIRAHKGLRRSSRETFFGAIDIVCTVHGYNMAGHTGRYKGPWADVPVEAIDHCNRVRVAAQASV